MTSLSSRSQHNPQAPCLRVSFDLRREPFMPQRSIPLTLATILALLGSSPCLAADKTAATPPAVGQAQAAAQTVPRLVDINSASRAELKTLPGIGDAQAERIIAARPYPSKAKLVAASVLRDEAYRALQGRIVAIQPAQTQAKATAKP